MVVESRTRVEGRPKQIKSSRLSINIKSESTSLKEFNRSNVLGRCEVPCRKKSSIFWIKSELIRLIQVCNSS